MSSTDAVGVMFDMMTLAFAAPAIEIDRNEGTTGVVCEGTFGVENDFVRAGGFLADAFGEALAGGKMTLSESSL